MWKIVLIAALAIVGRCRAEENEAKNAKDSYLAALRNSQKINATPYKGTPIRISRGDYNVVPSNSYDYSVPAANYGPPTGNELYQPAPHKDYGPPPKPVYGPPKPIYGPPPPPPPPPHGPVSHGMPYFSPENWLLSKLKFKFDLFTVAKILLKLVIFKKIVKFIALLCLLFFIPTLKPSGGGGGGGSHSDESSEEERRRSYDLQFDYQRRLGDVTKFALTALEAFTVDNALYCPEENLLSCRFKRMFDVIDESYPVSKIYSIYLPPEESEAGSSGENSSEHGTINRLDANVGQEEEN
uniref:Uncharacterized protein n=1 Tax=Anopheles atroparvus TaxID=41427 RepID=A0A182JB04_ANOAO